MLLSFAVGRSKNGGDQQLAAALILPVSPGVLLQTDRETQTDRQVEKQTDRQVEKHPAHTLSQAMEVSYLMVRASRHQWSQSVRDVSLTYPVQCNL